MKKRSLQSLKLRKQTISKLNTRFIVGAAQQAQDNNLVAGSITIPITYSIFFDCEDILHTSKDYDGKHCDIATINDSCLSVCDDKCNDF